MLYTQSIGKMESVKNIIEDLLNNNEMIVKLGQGMTEAIAYEMGLR